MNNRTAKALVTLVDGERIILDCLIPGGHFAYWPRASFDRVHMATFKSLRSNGLIEKVADSFDGKVTEWAASAKARELVDRRVAA